jgi:hypothetical protein
MGLPRMAIVQSGKELGITMKRYLFQIVLGAGLLALYLVLWTWHSPWEHKLTKAEIDQYLGVMEKLPLPPGEAKAKISRFRRWAEADDGKPFYMFNLIHFYPQLRTFPGAPEFKGTPRESNAYYMNSIARLWLSHAAYPIFDGVPQSDNLINIQPERTWGQVTVVRYPSRRTLLKLVSDPSYAPMEPYKFMAMELDLVPVSGDTVIPDLRWVLGSGLIMVFLLVGWVRAAWPRRSAPDGRQESAKRL